MSIVSRLVRLVKRLQRKALFTDDAEIHQRVLWRQRPADARYEEQAFSVAPDLQSLRSVLVFKPDEIGDVAMALPAIVELKRALPEARLSLLCKRATAPLFAATKLFDEIAVTQDALSGIPHLHWLPVKKPLASLSTQQFDLTVFLRTHPRYFAAFKRVPSRAQLHPSHPQMTSQSVLRSEIDGSFNDTWSSVRPHQTLQLLQIVGKLTGKRYAMADVEFPAFHWSEDDQVAASKVFRGEPPSRFGVIHPFVREETRRWPMEYWRDLSIGLERAFPMPWVIIGGPGDPRLDLPLSVLQSQGALRLTETGYLLSRAAAFVGISSGPAHWAGALGTPTVTLFGGKDVSSEFAPLGKSLVLRTEVPCSPCDSAFCQFRHLACLRELTPQRVLPATVNFLHSHNVGG
ncbi:MAG TPA: glycosyltransferase family 9 protein [Pirellulales bacterium]|jgi:ADP-heptose:LPS heptosyltransferase|nr:glycosyltransferase family 9 protein [Pirellulales bacterium]